MAKSTDQELRFHDRVDAGRRLAEHLMAYRAENPLVVALARGGVVVGEEVARALGAPLEVMVARKLGAPGQPELGVGAIAPGVRVVDERAVRELGISAKQLAGSDGIAAIGARSRPAIEPSSSSTMAWPRA